MFSYGESIDGGQYWPVQCSITGARGPMKKGQFCPISPPPPILKPLLSMADNVPLKSTGRYMYQWLSGGKKEKLQSEETAVGEQP